MVSPKVEQTAIADLRPYSRNPRTHSKKQIRQIANSIERFGFTNPVLISDDGECREAFSDAFVSTRVGEVAGSGALLRHLDVR